MRIIFLGGRQAGMIVLVGLLADNHDICCVVPVDDVVEDAARMYGLTIFKPKSLNSDKSIAFLKALAPELLVSVHSREILKREVLDIPEIAAINVHPCLWKYKGAKPIDRLLEDKGRKASVGVHYMTGKVDAGPVIREDFVDVSDCTSVVEVYNKLYPLYLRVTVASVKHIFQQYLKTKHPKLASGGMV